MPLNLNPILLAAAAVLALHASAAQANLLVNGSFETGPAPGANLNMLGGSTAITGWTVTGSTIDYVGSLWQHSYGNRSIDLDGSAGFPHTNGGVAQSFATTPGTPYVVRFDLAGNPNNAPTLKPMRVSAAGQSQDFTFDITGRSYADMGWVARSWTFSAVAATTTLEFRSLTQVPPIGWGAALDNVSVTVIPEPGTWALMLSGLLAVVGMARRDRNAGAPAGTDAEPEGAARARTHPKEL